MERTFIDVKRFKKVLNEQANGNGMWKEYALEIKQHTKGVTDPAKIDQILADMIKEGEESNYSKKEIASRWKDFLNLIELKRLIRPGITVFLDEYEDHSAHVYVFVNELLCIDDLLIKCLGWEVDSINHKRAVRVPVRPHGRVSDTANALSRDLYGEDGMVNVRNLHTPHISL